MRDESPPAIRQVSLLPGHRQHPGSDSSYQTPRTPSSDKRDEKALCGELMAPANMKEAYMSALQEGMRGRAQYFIIIFSDHDCPSPHMYVLCQISPRL